MVAVIKRFKWVWLGIVVFCAGGTGCVAPRIDAKAYRDGSHAGRIIEFSGHTWRIKNSQGPVGPGPNHFSDSSGNVWVDEQGRLHLKITRREGIWHCAEIVCETPVGYGTYVFYLEGRVDEIDRNAVLGLFTWDDDSFQTQANTEIDIEFSQWTEPDAPNLWYSVQPTRGPDESSGRYFERFDSAHVALRNLQSTQVFSWMPDSVAFAMFEGHSHPTPYLIEDWYFDATNHPARCAGEGDLVSDPVLIPVPGPETSIRMNLWLVDGNGDGYGDVPSDGDDVEVIISRFDYIAFDHSVPCG